MRSEALQCEERDLRAEILDAFRSVDRAEGVSWSETRVLDDYGSPGECLRARRSDKDRHWWDLVDDPEWQPDKFHGGFAFLDAIGFRYYLPAAMMRCLAAGYGEAVQFHLTIYKDESDSWKRDRHASLDDRQRRCVARFVRFMIALSVEEGWDDESQWWKETLASGWDQF